MTQQRVTDRVAWWWALVFAAAVFIFVVVLHTLTSDTELSDQRATALALTQALAVLLTIRRPLLGCAVSLVSVVVASVAVGLFVWVDPMLNSYLLVLVLVSVRVNHATAAAIWAATVTAGATTALVLRPPSALAELVESAVLCALVLVAGGAVRGLIETRGRLAVQTANTERERERNVALAERTRIARELHDVVVHHMSVVAIQAQAAQFRIDNPPPELQASLATIHASASAAMTEMRRILGALRADDTLTTDPAPTLADVGRLVDTIRATGVRLEQRTTGPVRPLPGLVEVSAYRIIQESLSNAVRHAPGSEIAVIVRYNPAEVDIEIRNGPGVVSVPAGRVSGHGLLGMRERADILGGSFTAEPTAVGGFRVAARLPI